MKTNRTFILTITILFATAGIFVFAKKDDDRFVSYTVDTKKEDIQLYWKDDKSENFRSIQNLKLWLEKNKRKKSTVPLVH